MKWCHSVKDIPKEPHYAILELKTTWIPGDERSRTHPGHGYPEHTEQSWDYIVFDTREEWEAEIESRQIARYGRHDFVAISATPATITTSVKVNIS